jgi:acyl-CoA synthetase (AMP-forming)/AMP-acid ligase II
MSLLSRIRLARDRSVTVANLVDELLRRNGDCVISVEDAGDRRLSHLHGELLALDAFLRNAVKLQPGQPVAIYRSNDAFCFRWFLAVIRAGGIAVPLNPMLTASEVRRILERGGIDVLVTDQRNFERNIKSREALPIRTWIEDDREPDTMAGFLRPSYHATETFAPAIIDPAATIAVFHTSGTSGFPKGAALSSRALLGPRGFAVLASMIIRPKDLSLVALPWSHIMAISTALYGLMAGTRGCFLEHFEAERALEMIERRRITTFVGVPTMFHRLMDSEPDPKRLSTVRVWVSASDHLPVEVRQRLRNFGSLFRLLGGRRLPPLMLNAYGMVELGGMVMIAAEWLTAHGDLCFPVPPFKVRIADENNRPVPRGVTGECQVTRRGFSPHYWANEIESKPEAINADEPAKDDALLTSDGWLRTGDLAVRNRLGLVRFVGRMKDVIKSGGYSVYARELEEAIAAHPAVAKAAAFGLPHKEKGEFPAAAVELHTGSATDEAELLAWCRERLAPYKAPRRIWIVASGGLPLNSTGKVLRRELRERFAAEVSESAPAAR